MRFPPLLRKVCVCIESHRVALCTSVNIGTLAQIATECLKAVNKSCLNIKIILKFTVTQNKRGKMRSFITIVIIAIWHPQRDQAKQGALDGSSVRWQHRHLPD